MKTSRDCSHTRRDFLRDAGRYPVCGLLILLGLHLTRRSGRGLSPCHEHLACRDCRVFAGCTLPRARLVKQNRTF